MTTDARVQRWLYSPGIDTGIFGGSALLSLGLLLAGG